MVPTTIRHRDEHGAAAVEMAILLPVLVLLVFGIVQFSILFNRLQGLHAAAREGARVAALPQSDSGDIDTAVNNALDGVLPSSASRTITVSPSSSNPCDLADPEARVTVTVKANTALDIPLWGSQTVSLTGKGEFKCE